jgi:hypothetical protein
MKVLSNEDIVLIEFAIATLEDLEYLHRYLYELEKMAKNRVKLDTTQIQHMFELQNRYYRRNDTGYHCDTCRKTVYKDLVKLKPYLNRELYERTQSCQYRDC